MSFKNLHQVGPSSLGEDNTTTGPSFSARGFWNTRRRAELELKGSYFACRQHDSKRYDFDGRLLQGANSVTQPLIAPSPVYIPLKNRRPSAPYRVAKSIVVAFTAMLFGEHRFPELCVPSDGKTQDYARALMTTANLPARFLRARNLGGAMGTGCLSWCFIAGKPRTRVHSAKNIVVHEWDDRDEFIPRSVSEVYQGERDVFNPETKKVEPTRFWCRRDWTPDADITYVPVRVREGEEPDFKVDLSRTFEHKDGICHFVWVQNRPDEGDDGESDYEGLLDNFDALDITLSILFRGAVLNLDPTLKLKMDPDLVNRMGVKKGSDNALVVGEQGDAEYMELEGTSIEKGIELFNKKRALVLEIAQCVFPDPDKVAAAGLSSVALKAIYKPMTDATDVLRAQWAPAIRRLIDPWVAIARQIHKSPYVTIYEPVPGVPANEDGTPVVVEKQIELYIDLPPRVVETEAQGPDGEPVKVLVPREPGDAENVDVEWGPYFLPTPADQQQQVTTLTTAVGTGVPVLSRKTATGLAAATYGKDAREEWEQIQREQSDAMAAQSSMFADASGTMGGSVKRKMTLPGGGSVEHSMEPPPPAPPQQEMPTSAQDDKGKETLPLTPSAWAAVTTVNEARMSIGLDPLPDEDGHLTVVAFQAKYQKPVAEAANAELGKTGTAPANPPPKPAPGGAGAPPGHPGAAPPHPAAPPGGLPPIPGA